MLSPACTMGIEKPPRWSLGGFSCANYDRFVCQAHYSTVPRWDASDALQYRSATVEKLYYCRHRGRLRTFGRLGGGAMRIADNRHFRRSMATWQDTKKEMPACVGIQVSPAAPCKRAATTPYPLVNLLEVTPRPCLQVTPAERQMSPTAGLLRTFNLFHFS